MSQGMDERDDGNSSPGSGETESARASGPALFISISGLIGAGKSTLATALSKEMGLPCYYEPVEQNIYLDDFYKDMKAHGFAMQIYLLNKRFEQHQRIIWSGQGAVQDRSIYEDSVFARVLMRQGNISPRDYQTYLSLFRNISNFMRHPNLIVHLDVTPEEALERIKARSRGCETGVSLEYLRVLHEEYNQLLSDLSKRIPVIRVRWSQFKTAEEMARVIHAEYRKMRQIVDVGFGSAMTSPIIPSDNPYF